MTCASRPCLRHFPNPQPATRATFILAGADCTLPPFSYTRTPVNSMQPFTRHLSLALIPLLTFLAVAMAGEAWLQKETRRLQADAVAARRAQVVQALAITQRGPGTR